MPFPLSKNAPLSNREALKEFKYVGRSIGPVKPKGEGMRKRNQRLNGLIK